MSKKEKIKSMLAGVEQTAESALCKGKQAATTILDKDNDGKFDLTDLSIIKESAGAVIRDCSDTASRFANNSIQTIGYHILKPITRDTLNDADFIMSKLICISERTKKYSGNEITKDSIGFLNKEKGMEYVNIFWDSIDAFDITLLPNENCDFYYVDPIDRNKYIALDYYFDYLRDARINELQVIAHDLGAKYFKVTYLEKKKTVTEKKTTLVSSISWGKEKNEITRGKEDFTVIETKAESHFPGHEPVQPVLEYLKNNKTIEGLISMRLKKDPITEQHIIFEFSSLSGLNTRDAAKIDAVFKGLKCSGNVTVESEAKSESRKALQYDIEF